jgi:hypothetical protein
VELKEVLLTNRVRDSLSYANVMATVAVFLALTGVGLAALKLPKDSVGAKQIKTGGVRTDEVLDVDPGAVLIGN